MLFTSLQTSDLKSRYYIHRGVKNEHVDLKLNEFDAINFVVFNTTRTHGLLELHDIHLYKSDIRNLELSHI